MRSETLAHRREAMRMYQIALRQDRPLSWRPEKVRPTELTAYEDRFDRAKFLSRSPPHSLSLTTRSFSARVKVASPTSTYMK